jgi:hypothetical protein
MKLRTIKKHIECEASQFNIHSLNEIIVYYAGGDADSAPISDFDVFLESNQMWKYMPDAFADHDLIPDETNTYFREPNDEERDEGCY